MTSVTSVSSWRPSIIPDRYLVTGTYGIHMASQHLAYLLEVFDCGWPVSFFIMIPIGLLEAQVRTFLLFAIIQPYFPSPNDIPVSSQLILVRWISESMSHSLLASRCMPLMPSIHSTAESISIHSYWWAGTWVETCVEQQQGQCIILVYAVLDGDLYDWLELASRFVFHSPPEFLMSMLLALYVAKHFTTHVWVIES